MLRLLAKMSGKASYTDPYKLNEPVYGYGIGVVAASKNEGFAEGDLVFASLLWAEFTPINAKAALECRKLPPATNPEAALSALGPTGVTAYFGLLDIGQPKEGEVVVVSGASGATGSVVGQIAKIKGCRVVGIAGSDDKVEWLTKELGFDAAINYRTSKNLAADLTEACGGKGVDVYFDNVGGTISDTVIFQLNNFGRVVNCGSISTYNEDSAFVGATGPRFEGLLITKRLKFQGFIVSDYLPRWAEAVGQLAAWLMEGKLKHKTTVKEGFDSIVDAFLGLFDGSNTGKMLVKL